MAEKKIPITEAAKQAKYVAQNIKEAKLFPKRVAEYSKLASKLGKRMGKLGIAGNIMQAYDWAKWQKIQAERRKKGYSPEEGGGQL